MKNNENNEEEKLNINFSSNNKNAEKYKKYKIVDSDSNISNDDIEAKMERYIKIKKSTNKPKDKNLTEEEKIKLKAEKFKKDQNKNREKKKIENKKKIKKGFEKLMNTYDNHMKKLIYFGLKKNKENKDNIKKGLERLDKSEIKFKKNFKRKKFKEFKKYYKNKIEEEERKKIEEEKKKIEEEKRKIEEEKKKLEEEKKKKEKEKKKKEAEEKKKKEAEEKKKIEEEKKKKIEEEEKNKEEEEKLNKIKDQKKKKKEDNKEEEKNNNIKKKKDDVKKKKPSLKVSIEDSKINELQSKINNEKQNKKKKSVKLSLFENENEKNDNNNKEESNKNPSDNKIKTIKINSPISNEESKNEFPKLDEHENLEKIEDKRKKLEERKKKQEKFLKDLEEKKTKGENDIKNLEKLIQKQKLKASKINEGDLNVSKTDSLIPSEDLDNFTDLSNDHPFKTQPKNSKKNLRNKSLKKMTSVIDSLIIKKLKVKNSLFNFEEDDKENAKRNKSVKDIRNYQKKTTQTIGNLPISFRDIYLDKKEIEDENNLRKKKMRRQTTIRQVRKGTIKEETFLKKETKGLNEDGRQSSSVSKQNESEELNVDNTLTESEKIDEQHIQVDKSELMEYDKFYKEQFFKTDVFNFDLNDKDKEEEEITKDVSRMEIKKKMKEKMKLKKVNLSKGLDVTDLDKEIDDLKAQLEKLKKVSNEGVDLIMNNTEQYLYHGMLLKNYFYGKKYNSEIPRFSLESAKDKGAKEIIDFKPLNKEETARRYYDDWCCLKQRKKFNNILVNARYWALLLVGNQYFDNFSLLVIITNTILILISDPRDNNSLANTGDSYFLYFYTLEAILKIIAYGFIGTEFAYLKDPWNMLDFFVVFVGWISFILERAMNGTKISGLAGLRAFRILRPLKTVKSVKGLKKLVIALLASISHLGEIFIVLFFFFLIFSIAGTQMWQGNLKRRCMSESYGYLVAFNDDKGMCTFDSDCKEYNENGNRFICVKGFANPKNGVISFDNSLIGMVTVFVIVTLEGWTQVFTFVSKTFKDKIYVNPIIIFAYFHFFVFVGGFYLINLFLAVTNSEFEKIEILKKELSEKKSFVKLIKSKYDLKEKEKQEKKKKDKELKNKNLKKSSESLYELYYKVDDEAFHIEKNIRDIPKFYSTVKDMYIMTNNNPEELYNITKMIDAEEKYLCQDIKRQQKEIDKLIDEKKEEEKKINKIRKEKKKKNKRRSLSRRSSLLLRSRSLSNRDSVSNLDENTSSRPSKTAEKNPAYELNPIKYEDKFFPQTIEISILQTQTFMKQEMIKLQNVDKIKAHVEMENNLRHKIEKKELKNLLLNQITKKPDLSFEKEIREQKQKELELQKKKNESSKLKLSGVVTNILEDKKKNEKKQKLPEAKNTNNSNFKNIPNQRGSVLISKKLLKNFYRKKNYKNNINDELSFMTDLSISNLDDSKDSDLIDNNTKNSKSNLLINDTISNDDNQSKNESLITEKTIIADKNLLLNEANQISNDVEFTRPKSILPEIIKLQNDKDIQVKLEKMRHHFNLNNYLNKEINNGQLISTIGRRRSFLGFLQYSQQKQNYKDIMKGLNTNNEDEDDKLNLSLYNKDDISNSNISLSDISLLPNDIPENNKIYGEILNLEEMSKKQELNKYTSLARKTILDKGGNSNTNLTTREIQRFYKKINFHMNNNIIVDSKIPRGRNANVKNRSHIFINLEKNEEGENSVYAIINDKGNYKKNEEKKKIENKVMENNQKETNENINNKVTTNTLANDPLLNNNNNNNINTVNINQNNENNDSDIIEIIKESEDKKKENYLFKSYSPPKNELKIPTQNSLANEVMDENKKYTDPLTVQQDNIPHNLRGKKFYMNYLNNIMDKDLKVKDSFKVDHWVGDVQGKKRVTFEKKPLPETTEAVFVFNDKKLNLKKYKYCYHKDIDFLENECAVLTHALKNLPIQILEIMPMRMRDFGKSAVHKEIFMGTLSSRGASNKISIKNSNIGNPQTASVVHQHSKSSVIMSSAFSDYHKYHDDLKYKKGFYERVFKKIEEFNYRTLALYFDDEENLYFKFTDEKRREEREKLLEEQSKQRANDFEVKDQIKKIHIYDTQTNSHRYVLWSGVDIQYNKDQDKERNKWNNMIGALEDFSVIIWNENPGVKRVQKIRYAFYVIAINPWFDYLIILVVLINAVFMALDGNMFNPETYSNLNISNYVFNGIFFAEFIIKIIGLGPIIYFSDAFTYLDVVIIIFAIIDMVSPSSNTQEIGKKQSFSSSLSFLRVFRIFRVLRLTKILRKLKSMRLIIVSIKRALINVAYIVCILLMFILIFVLLGMSLLNGNIHYQSFMECFYVTFQILTGENWNSILYELYPMNFLSFFYLLVWIFLGNYIIFNLFTSILLQSFQDDEEDDDDEDEDTKIEKMYELPEYLLSIQKIETEHKNKLKKKKNSSNSSSKNDDFNLTSQSHINNSNSYSQSRNSQLSQSGMSQGSESESQMLSSSNMDDEKNDEDEEDTKVYTGVDKDIKQWQRVNKIFKRNECEDSLGFLAQTNRFRIFCMLLISNKHFDRVILIMILLSTVRLILDTFIDGYVSVLIFDLADVFFNVIFLLECLAKIFALGFVLDEGSYLTDNWNRMDLVVVICSVFDFQNLFTKYLTSGSGRSSNLQFLKVLRLLRTLRPLRFISHNGQLKIIISSLFDSIGPICNALLIVLVVYFMFSIVGISLFYTNYHNCYIKAVSHFDLAAGDFSENLRNYKINGDMISIQDFCGDMYNGIMDTGPAFKFSNIFISIITSYVLSNTEGWPDIMNSYRIYSDFYGIFFIVYILVVSSFFINLFTGIMFKYFNESWSREQKVADDDKKAQKYYDFLQQIEEAQPDYPSYNKPKEGTIRYYIREFADSNFLDNFIMIIIFLNMISMAMNYDGCDTTYEFCLKIANFIFTGIFIAECLIKLVAYGPVGYFYFGWNKFDFFVVIASLVDIIVANIDGIDASFLKSFQIIRVLRVLRVTRVLRLVKALKGLEKLIQTLRWSISALTNVFILMFIIFCIFAIMGCYLYDGLKYSKYKDSMIYMNQYYNLNNFYNAFLLVFRCTTGEDWPSIMMELANINKVKFKDWQAYVYMIISNFICCVIMLNLFLMVTLQQYDEFTQKTYNPIEKFEGFCEEFRRAWNKYSNPEDKGFRIKKILITNFFMDFTWKKLNFPETNKIEYVKKYVSDLKLRTDPEDYVYFHDVLYKIIYFQMGQKIQRNNPQNAIIFKIERKVYGYVKKMIQNYIKSHNIIKDKNINPFQTFNPLTSHLYFKITYLYLKSFVQFYNENVENMVEKEEINESLSSESHSASISEEKQGNNIIIGEKTPNDEEEQSVKINKQLEGIKDNISSIHNKNSGIVSKIISEIN